MRWPWQQSEKRQAGSAYADALVRLIRDQAGTASDVAGTAALEAAAGSLSRSFAAARVSGPQWARGALSPRFLGQVGRDLVRRGESLHLVEVSADGRLDLLPGSTWYFQGSANPSTWRVVVTIDGPTSTTTRHVDFKSVIFTTWGTTAQQPYLGLSPASWSATSSRLHAETERSLADESAGPLAQLLSVPADGGDDGDEDPLKDLKSDLRTAKGKAVLLETVAAAWGEGRSAAPQRDWMPSRLGPEPPVGLVQVRTDSYKEVLAAAGASVAMFDDSDGTSKRESLRQFFLGTVKPLARMLETELTAKLETEIGLSFDLYNADLAGRAQAFQKMVAAGMDLAKAAGLAGLMETEN